MFDAYDSAPIEWPEEVKAKLDDFSARKAAIDHERTEYIREQARALGLTASDLSDLRSETGRGFAEETQYGGLYDGLRTALEQSDDRMFSRQQAYWCGMRGFNQELHEGCGWVIGVPIQKPYDTIGLLSGSRGVEFYCRVCGRLLGRHRRVLS